MPPSFLQTRRSEANGDGVGVDPNRVLPESYKVFIHDLPPVFNEDLLDCYKNQTGMYIWEDDSKEKAQNAGDVWLHKALLDHPRRTMDPTEATTFLVPFYGFLSSNLSGREGYHSCNGLGHWNRTHRLAEWLKVNPQFMSQPERHVVPISYWAVARKEYPKWDDELFSVLTGELYEMLQKVRLLVYEPRFGSFRMEQEYTWWNGPLTTIPYVASMSLINAMDAANEGEFEAGVTSRPTMLYFRGNTALDSSNASFISEGQKVRRTTFEVFGQVTGARIEDSSVNFSTTAYLAGMTSSTFCLVPKGDTPTSRRLFDAIVAGCIPIIVSDEIFLPFDGFLDWGKFAIKVQEKDVLEAAGSRTIADYIERIPKETIQEMQVYLRSVRDDFIYGRGSPLSKQPGRCIDNILLAVARAGPSPPVTANASAM